MSEDENAPAEGPGPARGSRLLLVAVSLLVAGLLGELILRSAWTNPYASEDTDHLLKVRRPHAMRRFPVDRVNLDPDDPTGWYRTDERAYALPSRRFEHPDATVLFLGGSTTECLAVTEALRFPALVSDLLAEQGMKVDTLNAAMSGNNMQDSLNVLLNHAVNDEPDVAVLMHAANDIVVLWRDGSYRSRMGGPASFRTASRWALQAASIRSSFFGALRWQLSQHPVRREEFELRASLQREQDRIDPAPFEKRLRAFVGMARGFGIEPVLMTQPAVSVRSADEPAWISPRNQEIFNELIRRVAEEEGVVLVDLERHLVEQVPDWDRPMKTFYDGIHVTDEGSRVYARYIARRLRESVLH